jgi:endonuclease YncB( thermonuclease family)
MMRYFVGLFAGTISRILVLVILPGVVLTLFLVMVCIDTYQRSWYARERIAAEEPTIPQCPPYVDAAQKPRYSPGMKPFVYPVLSIIDVHDGDSGWVNLDLGFQISRKVCYRLDGLDAPEVTGPQKAVGLAVRDVVESWLKRAVICESKSLDKYGRALVVFYDKDGVSLNDLLLKSKMALAYKGESKSAMWSQAELRDALAAAKTATTPLRP